MSVLVFAGASQFVAVPMIAAGAPPLAVVLTTYVVNMRHYLMAATLAPSFGRFRRPWLALIAHLINDESFAVTVARSRPPDPGVYIGSAAAVCGAFLAGVVTGTLLGGLVADPEREQHLGGRRHERHYPHAGEDMSEWRQRARPSCAT